MIKNEKLLTRGGVGCFDLLSAAETFGSIKTIIAMES
jgi:hypothetical protein